MAIALHEDPLRLNLAISMYLLAAAVFLPVSGWAADKFGAKRVFVVAVVLYGLSSAACGFATDLLELVLARILQGVAGAMMAPVGRLVLLRTTPKDELVGAMSVLTIPSLMGPMVGPVLGGAIVTFWDWRWIFFINLPIAVLGIVLVLRYVPNVQEHEVSPLDWRGLALTGLGLACLVFGFENLGRSIVPPAAVVGLFAFGALCLWLYGRHARGNPHAILDLSLFRIPTFHLSVIGGAYMRLAMGATPFLLAMMFQIGFGMSPFQAGLLTFMSAAGALIMKTTAPPILRRFGFRSVLVVNAVVVGVLFLAYALFQPEAPHWIIMTVLLVGGFFRSLQITSLNGLAYADIDQPQMSRASTISSMSQQLTQSVGVGQAALMLHWVIRLQGDTQLDAHTVQPVFIAIGLVSFVSLAYYLRLAPDAGDHMNGRVRPA
jgi:EmrB/QacA subfamily drug resistance transporter